MKVIKGISLIIIALALVACSFSVNVPSVKTGETQQFDINEPVPAGATESRLEIEMGAGELNINGGASGLVSGSVRYNVSEWKPGVTKSSSGVRIAQESTGNISIPEGDILNKWNLQLGSLPLDLQINAGAYKGTIDLGGCSITDLQINDGASKAEVTFSQPNLVRMNRYVYKTGASQVDLLKLGNANATEIDFEGGAGSYTFDLSGTLTEDTLLRISSGLSNVKILIPKDSHAVVEITGGVSNIDASGTWEISGSTYTMGTSGPLITIKIEMAVGNLQLVQE